MTSETGQLREDNQDRISRTGWPAQDRLVRTGYLGQDIWGRTTLTGQQRQVGMDKSA
jgi:hypothetical protein